MNLITRKEILEALNKTYGCEVEHVNGDVYVLPNGEEIVADSFRCINSFTYGEGSREYCDYSVDYRNNIIAGIDDPFKRHNYCKHCSTVIDDEMARLRELMGSNASTTPDRIAYSTQYRELSAQREKFDMITDKYLSEMGE